MSLKRRIILTWMVAVTIHLPFPVCDGDDLTSWEVPALNSQQGTSQIDIDLVLLGCDLPDDVDDGPVDDDPEEGSGSSFGAYFTSTLSRSQANPALGHHSPWGDANGEGRSQIGRDAENSPRFGFLLQTAPPPGKFGPNKGTVLRC